ncbi:MAG TPA: hypothetical protein VHB48_18625 [Chitinophagaceae bacterium]|nr:hypothetical protein [Chitinophagaceae bacterium]
MFAASETPLSLSPEALDQYLARGWFRMNQTIFTTHFLQFNYKFYSAVWLRVNLQAYMPGHAGVLKRIDKLRTEVKRAEITKQHEALYEKYKTGLKFDTHTSLKNLLHGGYVHNIYNTWQVNLYNGETLIASGFFDMGKTSAEGIVSIYHPDYKKYSLGKCIIYTKIDYCRQQGLHYFYPGYVVPGYAAFDYKLGIGTEAIEYFNAANSEWLPFKNVPAMYQPLADMQQNLAELQAALTIQNQQAHLMHYLFFDALLNISPWQSLLDYPVFLLIRQRSGGDVVIPLVLFNIVTRRYVFTECMPVYSLNSHYDNKHIFSSDVLNIHREVYASTRIDEMAVFIEQYTGITS